MNIVLSYDLITTEDNKRNSDFSALRDLFEKELRAAQLSNTTYFISFKGNPSIKQIVQFIENKINFKIKIHKNDKFYISYYDSVVNVKDITYKKLF